jgi:predicted aconitase
MKLTDDEKRMLQGDEGRASRKAMEIIVALGKIFGAGELVPVFSVQVSGVSYHNLGEAGLEWLEEMALDGRAATVATLNPAGMDLEAWAELGVDQGFAARQLRVVEAYRRMGLFDSCTCTPYLVGNVPAPGEHLAWSESSAVAVANSVFGARTNREGGPSALAAALTGRTPAYGLHLQENRRPQLEVELPSTLPEHPEGTAWWGVLGCALGRLTAGRVPRLRVPRRPTMAELKSLCASVVTYGGSPLVHLSGVTPEAERWPLAGDKVTLTTEQWDEARASLVDEDAGDIDLVCLGCPHASLLELAELAHHLEGRKVQTTTWICTARTTAQTAERQGLVARIEASGARVVCDTCFVVAPLRGHVRTIATDSAKGCFYARGHNAFTVKFGSVEQCLAAAVTGRWE